jgi:methyltransferase family protein
MPPMDYLVLRLIRRHLPDRVIHALLGRGLIIRPGLETRSPPAATRRFLDALKAAGESVAGRRAMIFGYGGRFDVGVQLLEAGAHHVVLVDPYAPPLPPSRLAPESAASRYLTVSGSRVVPDPQWFTVLHAALDRYTAGGGEPVDFVFSNSVLEHVEDVAGTARDLARVTAPAGQNFHFIDLRDHFFKHPFEMLCYSEREWRRFLNPGSNLNRFRSWDYERLFSESFGRVTVEPFYSNLPAFRAVKHRIRPEFLSGDEERDAVTHVLLRASQPRSSPSA